MKWTSVKNSKAGKLLSLSSVSQAEGQKYEQGWNQALQAYEQLNRIEQRKRNMEVYGLLRQGRSMAPMLATVE